MSSTSKYLKQRKIKVRWFFATVIFLFHAVFPAIVSINDVLAALNSATASWNNRNLKIVGVLTQPLSPRLIEHFKQSRSKNEIDLSDERLETMTYVASSYLSWMKKKEVIVIPINPSMEKNVLDNILSRISGLLIPGGKTTILLHDTFVETGPEHYTSMRSTKKSEYAVKALYIIQFLMRRQKLNNIKIPIFGTCLGFELLILNFGHPDFNFRIVDNLKQLSPLRLESQQSYFPPKLIPIVEQNPFFYFNHKYAITVDEFNQCEKLTSAFEVLAVSYKTIDTKNKDGNETTGPSSFPFVAVVKAKDYPFAGVQFHPEKNEFETSLNLPNKGIAIETMDLFSERFVADLEHTPEKKDRKLMYSYYKDLKAFEVESYGGFKKVYVFASNPILPEIEII